MSGLSALQLLIVAACAAVLWGLWDLASWPGLIGGVILMILTLTLAAADVAKDRKGEGPIRPQPGGQAGRPPH